MSLHFWAPYHTTSLNCARCALAQQLISFFDSATSLGMTSDEEKKMQRIEDIKELLS